MPFYDTVNYHTSYSQKNKNYIFLEKERKLQKTKRMRMRTLRKLDAHQANDQRSIQTAKHGSVHLQQTVAFTENIR